MKKFLVGVDEVGRGPIAGPVCVGVFVATEQNLLKIIKNAPHVLKDSKKLTKNKREDWSKYLHECKKNNLCDFAVSMESNIVIDTSGIVTAIQKAVNKSFNKLSITYNLQPKAYNVLLDAGLKPPAEFKNYQSIIKGDEKEPVIAMASILAKVHRDSFMTKLDAKHPEYGFKSNMGYGTAVHYIALRNKGILPVHRKTFLGNILD